MSYTDTRADISAEMVEAFIALSRAVDLTPGPGGSRITPVESARALPIIAGLFDDPIRVQFVVLSPSCQIVCHCDPPIAARRFHIPLMTNAGCWSFSAGEWRQLTVGAIYQMDPTQPHGAVNWGTEARLHVMVDVP